MLTGLGHPKACFLAGIKAFFMEHNDLWCVAEGGHDVAAYLYAILLYSDNGSAVIDDTSKWYMRRVVGGGSTTSRWLSNEECLPLREKVALAIHSSTWSIWGEPLPPPALLTVKIRQPSHEFTFGVGMTFVSYSLVLTPVV
jgi:hypothetical protein